MTRGKDPDCPKCGKNRWRTVVKREKWQCRMCKWMTGIHGKEYLEVKDIGKLPVWDGENWVDKLKDPWWKRWWRFLWEY